MCEICSKIRLYQSFSSPTQYMECNAYIKELILSVDFEFVSGDPLDQVKNEEGHWIDDIITHRIRCIKCSSRRKTEE